jgi:hypothetical protein
MAKKKSKVVDTQADGTEIHGFEDEQPKEESHKIRDFFHGKSEGSKESKHDIKKHAKFHKFEKGI